MIILGISCFYHDAAAVLLKDGKIVAAAEEERFTRVKHDSRFPSQAIAFCLTQASVEAKDIALVAFYEKPFLKLERILETHIAYAPNSLGAFLKAMPSWLGHKLFVDEAIRAALPQFSGEIVYTEHHESHAASAFFPSPFEEAAVLTIDGVGEWATTTIGIGKGNTLKRIEEIHFPHSLGLLYSAFTYFLGFKVNSGEYKVMGLAPLGVPKYADLIRTHLIDLKEDGSFRLHMEYFDYPAGVRMTGRKFEKLFGTLRRHAEGPLLEVHKDIAASIQKVVEEAVMKLALRAKEQTGMKNICFAGGVALNCVANGALLRSGQFGSIWIQPAAGDSGGALGAAYAAWHLYLGKPRMVEPEDAQQGSLLGPSYSDDEIESWLTGHGVPYERVDAHALSGRVADLLANQNVIGLVQGRMEYGPRALGARSIIADPRGAGMQARLNEKIKFRESFRPFAPSVLKEHASSWFDLDVESPYMLFTASVLNEKRIDAPAGDASVIPAVTHVDYSARVQTVDRKRNPAFHRIVSAFYEKTGCPVVLNTSLNVRGEPIACTIEDAYHCFMCTGMDYLVLGNIIVKKEGQPPYAKNEHVNDTYEPD